MFDLRRPVSGAGAARRVKVSYFIDLGQAAYGVVSETASLAYARLYSDLAEAFVPLTDVLRAMRTDKQNNTLYDVLLAAEHWEDTGSRAAFEELARLTDGLPIRDSSGRRH
ncbi:hypothetical protein [Alkalilimnicola ehrlichii]|uniref:hypothetical protein n=1 Tax=Alkalilimnicola ehrlichii TaxID=351052 RepID=UPI0011C072FF|nr:hypothetical protein [Alkalilimnicola ehrlichii]